jgi:hypothetical protein
MSATGGDLDVVAAPAGERHGGESLVGAVGEYLDCKDGRTCDHQAHDENGGLTRAAARLAKCQPSNQGPARDHHYKYAVNSYKNAQQYRQKEVHRAAA